jgi:hypothetical protein
MNDCGVKLITGMIASSENLFAEASDILSEYYGSVDYMSRTLPFDYTKYYEKEMGKGLIRQFVSFANLISPRDIADIKLRAIEIEKSFVLPGKRRKINIDPGYIDGAKLVLATTKNYDHRIYLDNGIYAEVTLHYRKGSFMPWEWTYPDYRSKEYIDIFNRIREIYLCGK